MVPCISLLKSNLSLELHLSGKDQSRQKYFICVKKYLFFSLSYLCGYACICLLKKLNFSMQ